MSQIPGPNARVIFLLCFDAVGIKIEDRCETAVSAAEM